MSDDDKLLNRQSGKVAQSGRMTMMAQTASQPAQSETLLTQSEHLLPELPTTNSGDSSNTPPQQEIPNTQNGRPDGTSGNVESAWEGEFYNGARPTKKLTNGINGLHKQELYQYGSKKVKVYAINDAYVRTNLGFTDWGQGGHDRVYPKLIPANEVWVSGALAPRDVKPFVLHEFHERNLMSQGMGYEDAHESANQVEKQGRDNPNQIDQLIKKEIELNLNGVHVSHTHDVIESQPHLVERVETPKRKDYAQETQWINDNDGGRRKAQTQQRPPVVIPIGVRTYFGHVLPL